MTRWHWFRAMGWFALHVAGVLLYFASDADTWLTPSVILGGAAGFAGAIGFGSNLGILRTLTLPILWVLLGVVSAVLFTAWECPLNMSLAPAPDGVASLIWMPIADVAPTCENGEVAARASPLGWEVLFGVIYGGPIALFAALITSSQRYLDRSEPGTQP